MAKEEPKKDWRKYNRFRRNQPIIARQPQRRRHNQFDRVKQAPTPTAAEKNHKFRSDVERRLAQSGIMNGMKYEAEQFRVPLNYTPDWVDYEHHVLYEVKKYIDSFSQRIIVSMHQEVKTVYTQWTYVVLVECSKVDCEEYHNWKYAGVNYTGSGKLSGKEAVLWLKKRGILAIPYHKNNTDYFWEHRAKLGVDVKKERGERFLGK